MSCFEDSAWSFNRLKDWTALFTFMNLLLCMVIFSLTRSCIQGDSCPTSLPRMSVDQLRKRQACFKHSDMLLQDSDDIKNVLYTLGPRLLRTCCSVLCSTTNPNPIPIPNPKP